MYQLLPPLAWGSRLDNHQYATQELVDLPFSANLCACLDLCKILTMARLGERTKVLCCLNSLKFPAVTILRKSSAWVHYKTNNAVYNILKSFEGALNIPLIRGEEVFLTQWNVVSRKGVEVLKPIWCRRKRVENYWSYLYIWRINQLNCSPPIIYIRYCNLRPLSFRSLNGKPLSSNINLNK